jgi:hypothetical protein
MRTKPIVEELSARTWVPIRDEHVRVIDLNGRVPSRVIALAWTRERGLAPAARHFMDAAVTADVAPALVR